MCTGIYTYVYIDVYAVPENGFFWCAGEYGGEVDFFGWYCELLPTAAQPTLILLCDRRSVCVCVCERERDNNYYTKRYYNSKFMQ